MIILSIDCAGAACAAGIWQNGVMLAALREPMQRGQDARLMPMIMAVIHEARLDFPQLDLIAAIRGPGSFTGLRVGLAAARGIGLAAAKPVIGIDRFAAYRFLYPQENLLVVIESKRAELFCRFYPADSEPVFTALMTQTEIADFIATHPATKIVGDSATPDDDILGAVAALAATADTGNPDFLPVPLYLREADVTFPAAISR